MILIGTIDVQTADNVALTIELTRIEQAIIITNHGEDFVHRRHVDIRSQTTCQTFDTRVGHIGKPNKLLCIVNQEVTILVLLAVVNVYKTTDSTYSILQIVIVPQRAIGIVAVSHIADRLTTAGNMAVGIYYLVGWVQCRKIILADSLIPVDFVLITVQSESHQTTHGIHIAELKHSIISVRSIGVVIFGYSGRTTPESITIVHTFDSTNGPAVLDTTVSKPSVDLASLIVTLHGTRNVAVSQGRSRAVHVATQDTACIDTRSHNSTFHTKSVDEDGAGTVDGSTDNAHIGSTTDVGIAVNNKILDNGFEGYATKHADVTLVPVNNKVLDDVILTIEYALIRSCCGAYRIKVGADLSGSAVNQFTAHINVCRQFGIGFCLTRTNEVGKRNEFFGRTYQVVTVSILRQITNCGVLIEVAVSSDLITCEGCVPISNLRHIGVSSLTVFVRAQEEACGIDFPASIVFCIGIKKLAIQIEAERSTIVYHNHTVPPFVDDDACVAQIANSNCMAMYKDVCIVPIQYIRLEQGIIGRSIFHHEVQLDGVISCSTLSIQCHPQGCILRYKNSLIRSRRTINGHNACSFWRITQSCTFAANNGWLQLDRTLRGFQQGTGILECPFTFGRGHILSHSLQVHPHHA